MACSRGNCPGTPICNATDICCIQFMQDCGDGCDGLLNGMSRIQVDDTGALIVCSNVGGNCNCGTVGGGATDQVVNNLDGTYTHTNVAGNPVIIDICDSLQFCGIGQLGNVDPTMDFPNANDHTVWNPVTQMWEPFRNVGPAILNFDQALGQTQALVQGVQTPVDFPNILSDPLGELTAGAGASFTASRTGCYDIKGGMLLETLGPVPDGNIVLGLIFLNGVQVQTFDWSTWVIPGTGNNLDGLIQTSSSQNLCLDAGDVLTFEYIQLAWPTGQFRGPDTFVEIQYESAR